MHHLFPNSINHTTFPHHLLIHLNNHRNTQAISLTLKHSYSIYINCFKISAAISLGRLVYRLYIKSISPDVSIDKQNSQAIWLRCSIKEVYCRAISSGITINDSYGEAIWKNYSINYLHTKAIWPWHFNNLLYLQAIWMRCFNNRFIVQAIWKRSLSNLLHCSVN